MASETICLTIASQFGEEPDEFHLSNLFSKINQIDCEAVLILGDKCLKVILDRLPITKWRGSPLQIADLPGRWIIPTYHPRATLPFKYGGEDQFLWKLLIQWDIKKALGLSQGTSCPAQRNLLIHPSFAGVMEWLQECNLRALNGYTIDFDIELMNMEVSCISITWDWQNVMSIPFIDDQGLYWSPVQETEIWLSIAAILENPLYKKRGQNLIFDTHFLLKRYGIKTHNIDDTMVAQRIIMPDYPIGLDFITSIYTNHPYYKDEGKKYFGGGNWPQLWKYNATDSSICGEAFPKQLENLLAQNNYETYQRQVKMIEPLSYAMERGIRIDVKGMQEESNKVLKQIETLKEELNQICGYELNPNSPKQLIQHFYVNKKIPVYKKQGKVTTDEKALIRIARKGHPEAAKILEIRRAVKKRSTYLDIEKVDHDGRMRCSYNPVGTRYSRISSSESIFGTGCFSGDVEVLTKSGWIKIKELPDNVEIMQWDSHRNLTWTLPEKVSYKYSGKMITFNSRYHNCSYTPDHRIPTITSKNNLKVFRADNIGNNFNIPNSGYYNGEVTLKYARLIAMIQADGTIESSNIRLSFKKERKINRFISLCKMYNINYTEQKESKGCRRFCITAESAKYFISFFSCMGGKLFGEWIFNLSQFSIQELLDEIRYWDSHSRGNSFIYATAIKQNAEWILTLAHIGGYSGNIRTVKNNRGYGEGKDLTIYTVAIKPREIVYQDSSMVNYKIIYDEDVYCLKTETSFFMIKSNGMIVVTGNSNMQNQPHDIMKFFLADENYIYYGLDLSQAENRIVAYLGNVTQMMEAFESKLDVHSLTASLISGIPPDEIKRQDDEDICCYIGDGTKTWRFFGKKANHGLNYDLGYKNFAIQLQVTEKDASFIVDRYHLSYPGVRQGFHKYIKDCLAEDRTLTNLMGRRTVFLQEWGDDLFKEAYSCIPQGTVGDIINEWGIEYLYYNQDLFGPVEFLIQIHDQIGIQIPVSAGLDYHVKALKLLKESLEQPLTLPNGNQLIIPVDIVCGLTMYKGWCKKLKLLTTDELSSTYEVLLKEQHERATVQKLD